MKKPQIQQKIWDRNSLSEKVQSIGDGQKIVFTNGCFDIIHAGHIDYLEKASQLGDFFIVAVNSDDSVKRLEKSPARPLQSEYSRSRVMASFAFVDAVVIFNEDTPKEIIEIITPDILVKGGDYQIQDIVGYNWVTQHGGHVTTIPFLEGYSTTAIEEKILNSRN